MKRVTFTAMAVATLITAGCGSQPQEPAASVENPEPVRVETREVRLTEQAQPVMAVGSVRAGDEVAVAARIMSQIQSIAVREGDRVRANQALVVLDDRQPRSQAAAARAGRQEAESAIATARQGVVAARSQLKLATLTHKRYADLLAKESVSQQEFDEATARLEAATAGLEAAESQQRQAEARQAMAEASIAQSDLALGYTVLTSPVSGIVTQRLADPGTLAAPGVPLLRIEQSGGYRLEVAVPESRVLSLRTGQTLPIRIDALGEAGPSEASIVEITPAVDPGSRTFTVKLQLPAHPQIRSGLYGYASLPGEPVMQLTVPSQAVVNRGQLRWAFVVDGATAHKRLITAGDPVDGGIVVLSGLSAGERVAMQPGDLTDGAAVVEVRK